MKLVTKRIEQKNIPSKQLTAITTGKTVNYSVAYETQNDFNRRKGLKINAAN